ncbi:NAD(P)H-dependent oxidoreductase subunit E [Clostridium bovifaecis]|uniref:NAD(P)H-dependent oxidoreductase subunit E n=1 Tax=Clostridium bovifaecis TaxID=2184719 RepID=A0A6I6EMM1_9CLOT|nr:NAD(P)H-dependent oxidoreductase subunit E [Clostridium bovifaecis]
MCSNILNEEKFKELEEFIDSLHSKEGALIEVLHKAQGIFGYLSKEVQIFIGEKLNIPISKVYGVITFYSYFTTEPRGKYVINVCMGTACFVRGSGAILKEFEDVLNIKSGETTPDGKFTLEILRCVGACGLAPVVTINNKVYGHFKKEQVEEILSKYSDEEVLSLD